jgi:Ca2+-binding EF-hand superfamily protein
MSNKPNKSSTIVDVEPSPAVKSAKEWFETIDADGSGELDQDELATLYQKARGEKLKGKQVSAPNCTCVCPLYVCD